MPKVEHRIHIKRSPGTVFAFLAQVEAYPQWQREAGIVEVTKDAEGPIRLGSTFSMQRAAGGRTATIDCEVTGFDHGERFAFHSIDSGGFVGDFVTTLKAGGSGGTDLQWNADLRGPNLLYRLLGPLIARSLRRSAAADLPRLKALLESR
ncbi:MAG TPA: SRPBCC family protein [Candidatus Angelobacter sp.]|nr:SRPBCC family protein [Candidatus Angelobacter sp.]